MLALPTDFPRPPNQSSSGRTPEYPVGSGLTQSLGNLARQQHTTLFVTLLAAFQTLLSRYSGQSRIVVGCPFAGRARGETEDLIGFCQHSSITGGFFPTPQLCRVAETGA